MSKIDSGKKIQRPLPQYAPKPQNAKANLPFNVLSSGAPYHHDSCALEPL